ncbi:MAG: uroporphyrinogen decarboxylase family protein, partial [Planctomycetota bacterium]
IVADFNQVQVEHYLEAPLDMMRYPEDLGMQQGPLLSPDHFRRYILPSYHRLMAPAAEAGCVVHMHSDGDLHALADDLLRLPIDVLNPQAEVNGIDWLAGTLKGRMCLDLSMGGPVLDRGDPAAIDAHVRRTVETLGSRDGGLMLRYGLYPGVAMANVAAIMDAFEKYSGYFS